MGSNSEKTATLIGDALILNHCWVQLPIMAILLCVAELCMLHVRVAHVTARIHDNEAKQPLPEIEKCSKSSTIQSMGVNTMRRTFISALPGEIFSERSVTVCSSRGPMTMVPKILV